LNGGVGHGPISEILIDLIMNKPGLPGFQFYGGAMSAVFDKAGIRFQYPENWQIVDEDLLGWPQVVSLQNPAGAFWTVMMYEPGVEPASLLRELLDQMRSEYDSLESSVATEEFENVTGTGYEMYFYCLDFLVCAKAFIVKPASGHVLLLHWQAEDRDFSACEPIFQAVTISLLRELASGGRE
jgi:hypothetical protein